MRNSCYNPLITGTLGAPGGGPDEGTLRILRFMGLHCDEMPLGHKKLTCRANPVTDGSFEMMKVIVIGKALVLPF